MTVSSTSTCMADGSRLAYVPPSLDEFEASLHLQHCHPPIHPIQSPEDKRQYRIITLKNGLTAFLCSDPHADKSAASLDVNIGPFAEPDHAQGLAHFLEHMLFMGTEKYPDEQEYSLIINNHAGSQNAYTTSERTNSIFDVSSSSLNLVLDRFAQFFVSPLSLCLPSAVDRELLAVNNERYRYVHRGVGHMSKRHAYGVGFVPLLLLLVMISAGLMEPCMAADGGHNDAPDGPPCPPCPSFLHDFQSYFDFSQHWMSATFAALVFVLVSVRTIDLILRHFGYSVRDAWNGCSATFGRWFDRLSGFYASIIHRRQVVISSYALAALVAVIAVLVALILLLVYASHMHGCSSPDTITPVAITRYVAHQEFSNWNEIPHVEHL